MRARSWAVQADAPTLLKCRERAFDGDKLWLILGLIWVLMTLPQREAIQENFPPPVAEMWANFAR